MEVKVSYRFTQSFGSPVGRDLEASKSKNKETSNRTVPTAVSRSKTLLRLHRREFDCHDDMASRSLALRPPPSAGHSFCQSVKCSLLFSSIHLTLIANVPSINRRPADRIKRSQRADPSLG
ncbi:unnamed protein product [Protopolystoma xenopodis]|uniref:Uncharacterized protein n=1 Tax=Protopolystoma xenopodis TaxID=117903 RepID=A0A448WCJ3_9PLAT|nr:unnamed protein product [Protopolystoma xenopodis]